MIMMIHVSFALLICIDPLSDASHPDGALINIISGEVCPPPPDDVNVDDQCSLAYIGKNQMTKLKSGWPTTFSEVVQGCYYNGFKEKTHLSRTRQGIMIRTLYMVV